MNGVVHGPMVPLVRAPDECDTIGRNAGHKGENMKPYEGKHETPKLNHMTGKHETPRGKT